MTILSSARFHLDRWRAIRAAERTLLPASAAERDEIDRVQRAFRALSIVPTDGLSENEADWNRAMNRLRTLGASADPRAFQRWDVIIARMAHIGSPATPIELASLRADPEWSSRWKEAIQEVSAGSPIPYHDYPDSSEVLIQTAYHTRELERLSGRRVSEWDVIVEFGGGFGGLCRLMHTLGFRGRYLIFDLPPFTELQHYYLRSVGLLDTAKISLTSEWSVLEQFVREIPTSRRAAFWATWSLSETPRVLRERLVPLVERIGTYCMAYQRRYGDVDNHEFFSNSWTSGSRTVKRISHRPDDYYIVGDAK